MTVDQMNLLQSEGVISDNAILWEDVCESDQNRALEFFAASFLD